MNSFGRIVVVLIAVIFIALKPLQYGADIQDTINGEAAEKIVNEFVHDVCVNGVMTLLEYEYFKTRLSGTGAAYTVDIKIGEPAEENISVAGEGAFLSVLGYNSHELALSITESVLTVSNSRNASGIKMLSAGQHLEHDDRCYFGVKHICSSTGGSCYTWDPYYYQYTHSHTSSCPKSSHSGLTSSSSTHTWTCGHGLGKDDPGAFEVTNTIITYYCAVCGAKTGEKVELDCPACSSGGWSGSEGSCSATTINCSTQYDYSGSYVKNCGKTSGRWYYSGLDETAVPKCSQVVVSMVPVYRDQMIELGEIINNTCIATYLDGHQTVINCNDNYVSMFGEQEVSLTYSGLLYEAKNTGSLTVHADVKTLLFFTCPDCRGRYAGSIGGSDPGCPVCSQMLLGIRVVALKTEYALGEVIKLEVYAVYKDRESIINGWTSNYNPYQAGRQIVEVQYMNMSASVDVLVKGGAEAECHVCGGIYDTNIHSSCPDCSTIITKIKVLSERQEHAIGENASIYIEVTYKDGSVEYHNSGFGISGYDKFTAGMQHVEVEYKGFTDSIYIMVLSPANLLGTCENGHLYLYNSDGSDPGCPYCRDAGNGTFQYLEVMYNDEILKKLYDTGSVTLEVGEYFSVEVSCPVTFFGKIKAALTGISGEKRYFYGGRVR